MHEDESLNEQEIRHQVNRQIAAGADAVFCLGTNGEFYILSEEEKLKVIRIVVDEVKGRVPVYAGTGCPGTKATIALSLKAKELGVDVLSIISPYFAAISQKEIFEHYKAIAEAVDLPIVMYNMPARTGNNIRKRLPDPSGSERRRSGRHHRSCKHLPRDYGLHLPPLPGGRYRGR